MNRRSFLGLAAVAPVVPFVGGGDPSPLSTAWVYSSGRLHDGTAYAQYVRHDSDMQPIATVSQVGDSLWDVSITQRRWRVSRAGFPSADAAAVWVESVFGGDAPPAWTGCAVCNPKRLSNGTYVAPRAEEDDAWGRAIAELAEGLRAGARASGGAIQ